MLVLLALACLAPTPGDIGGCGQSAQDLDETLFFASKRAIDCDQCRACDIRSLSCSVACDGAQADPSAFPARCRPLVHDGEVCLRALLESDCDEYRDFMSDSAPSVPSECDFCPAEGP